MRQTRPRTGGQGGRKKRARNSELERASSGVSIPRPWISSGPELKYVDLTVATTEVNTNGAVIPLFYPATGDTVSTRTGNKVTIKHVYGRVQYGGATNQSALTYLIWDVMPNNVVGTAAQILSPAIGSQSFLNFVNKHRFVALKRKLADVTTSPSSKCLQTWSFNHKMNHAVLFSASTPAATDVVYGGLYLVLAGDAAPGTGPCVDITARFRIEFTDL